MQRLSPATRLLLVLVVLVVVALAVVAWWPAGGGSSSSATAITERPTATLLATASPAPSSATPALPTPGSSARPAAPTDGTLTLAQLLALLPTALEHRAGYSRDLFIHWIDANGDGCNTREEVLIAESLTPVSIGPHCSLAGGSWLLSV